MQSLAGSIPRLAGFQFAAAPGKMMARIPRAAFFRAGLRFAGGGEMRPLRRLTGGLLQGGLSAIAAVMAWIPTQALGLREGFWAAITAVAVAQTELNAAKSTARDQFAGAAIGG